jgi:hypothetical protein
MITGTQTEIIRRGVTDQIVMATGAQTEIIRTGVQIRVWIVGLKQK